MNKNSKQYSFLQKLLENGSVTVLRIHSEQFILETASDNKTKTQATITASSIPTILDKLKHEPAEAIEIEAAIADIEDQLMPVIKHLPSRRCLATSEQAFWKIAKVRGYNSEEKFQLDIDTVEEIFNRLVDVAYGTPAHRLDVPEDREFAATVLFLRELMHHAGFNSLVLSQ